VGMTRTMRSGLLFFLHLLFLPGCRLFPPADYPSEGPPPVKSEHNAQADPIDPLTGKPVARQLQSVSAVDLRDPDKPAKLRNSDPPYDAGSSPVGTDVKKKTPDGISGIVTLEPRRAADSHVFPAHQPLPMLDKATDFEPVVKAWQCMLEGRHPDAIKHLSAYDNEKQELFLRLLPPLTTLVKKRIQDLTAEEVAVLHKQFTAMLDDLRPRCELQISKMCYCKEVRGFANYDALPDHYPFLGGLADRIGEKVQLYIELKNFASEPTKDGDFLTRLTCSLELTDSTGKQVWQKRVEGRETTLLRRMRLNDFHARYIFFAPAIPAGTYRLTLYVADETDPARIRRTSRSLEFRVTPVANQASTR